MRLAIFGGTFDPIHRGHIVIAYEALERFQLDRVLFVPACRPPHKSDGPHASYQDRLAMVELAFGSDLRFEASRLEAGKATSYSIDTIRRVRHDLPPEDQLYFLIGADAFAEIETWREWREVLRLVEFIVVSRPGRQYAVPAGACVHRLDGLELDTSSSEIRRRLACGDRHVDVAPAVLDYIYERGLYWVEA